MSSDLAWLVWLAVLALQCRPSQHSVQFAGGYGGSPALTRCQLSVAKIAEMNYAVSPHPGLAVCQQVSWDLRGGLVLLPPCPAMQMYALWCCREPCGDVRRSGCSGKVCFPRYTEAALVLSIATRNSVS